MRSSSSGCCKTLFEVFRIGCWLVALHLREELWVVNYLTVLLLVLIGPCCTWLVHIWLEQLDIQEMNLIRRWMQLQCLCVQLPLIVSDREEKAMTRAKVWHDSCITVWRTGQEVLLSYFSLVGHLKKKTTHEGTQDKVLNISFLPQEEGWLTEASHNYNSLCRQELCNANHQIETFSYSAQGYYTSPAFCHQSWRGVVGKEKACSDAVKQCSAPQSIWLIFSGNQCVETPSIPWKAWSLEERALMGFSLHRLWPSRPRWPLSQSKAASVGWLCVNVVCSAKAPHLMRIRASLSSEGLSAQIPFVVPYYLKHSNSLREIL